MRCLSVEGLRLHHTCKRKLDRPYRNRIRSTITEMIHSLIGISPPSTCVKCSSRCGGTEAKRGPASPYVWAQRWPRTTYAQRRAVLNLLHLPMFPSRLGDHSYRSNKQRITLYKRRKKPPWNPSTNLRRRPRRGNRTMPSWTPTTENQSAIGHIQTYPKQKMNWTFQDLQHVNEKSIYAVNHC